MSEEKGFKKKTLIAAVIVAAWLCVTIVILGIFKIHHVWPALLTLLFFFEKGGDVKNLPNIFVGAVVGLLLAALVPIAVGAIAPTVGVLAGSLIVVFVLVFLIIILGDVAHMFFNNYAFVYFTIALIFGKEQLTVQWLIVLVAGGIFFTGGILVFAKLLGLSTKIEK
jgi:hypothetical protein